MMRVLVACEYSGVVRDAFIRAGHYAMSCDLLPTESPGPHYQGDVREVLGGAPVFPMVGRPRIVPWDLMIAHPPCTYLSVSGMHWTARGKRDPQLTEDALAFVRLLMDAPIPRICVENPVSVISTRVRKADQVIQPWQFGHDASKATCLWLKNLPPLQDCFEHWVAPRLVVGDGKWLMRWGNQTDSGQNKLPPSDDRWATRSKTYAGIARAMATQWAPRPGVDALIDAALAAGKK